MEIRVTERDGDKLIYSSDYGSPNSPNYVDIVDKFKKGLGELIKKTTSGPSFVADDVNYITNPKIKNSTWDKGLLVNATADFKSPVDKCEFWKELSEQIKSYSNKLGSSKLTVASDIDQLDPCRKEEHKGKVCGTTYCQPELGEVCIAGKVCGCPNGQKRTGLDKPCKQVESWNLPLWVAREGNTTLKYTNDLANPLDEMHKKLVSGFEKGIAESYAKTPLKDGFVVAEVNDIVNPNTINKASFADND
ncbi:unnamed protein product [Anisakis simplex]|uniref:SEA domain-containing protein n=1 Tax=Anisakis simplex TaxID=6269 RepID=A0A3P6NZJ7_ANISI|nr:unnamed protein product [Anisakis simplex]